MIVDDSRLSRQLIRRHIPTDEYQIIEAADGLEAFNLYKEKPVDLVFLDLTMPVWDGFETLWHLKNLDPQAKVVVITADIQTGSRHKVMELGALQLLPKPTSQEHILEALRKHLP